MTAATSAADAYGRAAQSWLDGPDRAYLKYAEAMVSLAPREWRGAVVADLAAGAGSVAHALATAGARPLAVDAAPAMVALARRRIPGMPAVAGDVLALPLRAGSVDGVTVGFCINHLEEPHRLLEEAARVLRPGGAVLVSTFARGPDHPAKDLLNDLAAAYGWRPSPWYAELHDHAALTDTVELLAACAERAGLTEVAVQDPDVDTGLATADEIVGWRLGMPEMAQFLKSVGPDVGAELRAEALTALGDHPPPLVRRILVLTARSRPGQPRMRSFLGS